MNATDGEHLPVSADAQQVAQVLLQMSLATAQELADVLGWQAPRVYPALKALREKGLATSVDLGSARKRSKPAARWFLRDVALGLLDQTGPTCHEEGNRCHLLGRLPMVEAFYQVAGAVKTLGKFEEFLWLDGHGLEAAVRYEHGWLALCWSGPLETADLVESRLKSLAQAWDDLRVSDQVPWPSRIVFLAADRWQHDLIHRVARKIALQDCVSVQCVAEGSHSGIPQPGPGQGRGWIHQPVRSRGDGGWPWDARVADSMWKKPNSPALNRSLRLISEYPGMSIDMGRRVWREGRQGKHFERCCRTLVGLGLVRVVPVATQKRVPAGYCLTRTGIDRIVREDRGTYRDYEKRVLSQSWVMRPDRRTHEEGVMGIMGQAMAEGLSVAAGWRSYEAMGRRGSLVPDGMIFLTTSPFGPTWMYLEYELSARGPTRVRKKLRAYSVRGRQDKYPVLVICRNDRAEENFWEVGGGLELEMLTTTVPRLSENGLFSNFRTWSMYGQPVRIG